MEKTPGTWLMRKMFCCFGTLVLLQNLMLFHWTAQINLWKPQKLSTSPAIPTAVPTVPVAQSFPPAESPAALETPKASSPSSRQLSRESSLFSVSREELRIFGEAQLPETVTMTVGFGSVRRQKPGVCLSCFFNNSLDI